jgi:hypothetical protein
MRKAKEDSEIVSQRPCAIVSIRFETASQVNEQKLPTREPKAMFLLREYESQIGYFVERKLLVSEIGNRKSCLRREDYRPGNRVTDESRTDEEVSVSPSQTSPSFIYSCKIDTA